MAEGGARVRKLVHHFGQRGFVLVRYQTPYTVIGAGCPNGTLFFLPAQEFTHDLH